MTLQKVAATIAVVATVAATAAVVSLAQPDLPTGPCGREAVASAGGSPALVIDGAGCRSDDAGKAMPWHPGPAQSQAEVWTKIQQLFG